MPGRELLVAGLLIVVVDLRFGGFDVIIDPVGWMFVVAALLGLTRLHPGFVGAAVAATIGILVGCATLLGEAGPVLRQLEGIATTGVVFGTCTALIALATSPRDRGTANTIRWLDLGLTALGFVPLLITGGETVEVGAELAVVIVPLVILALGVLIWFLVLVWRVEMLEKPASTGAPADSPA